MHSIPLQGCNAVILKSDEDQPSMEVSNTPSISEMSSSTQTAEKKKGDVFETAATEHQQSKNVSKRIHRCNVDGRRFFTPFFSLPLSAVTYECSCS